MLEGAGGGWEEEYGRVALKVMKMSMGMREVMGEGQGEAGACARIMKCADNNSSAVRGRQLDCA